MSLVLLVYDSQEDLSILFSMRNSVEKLTKKISKDSEASNEQVYVKEETVGVVVSKTTGDDNTFTVSGDETDYKKTQLADNNQPVLFSVGTISV